MMPTHVETILFKILGDSKSGESAFDRMAKRLRTFGAALTAASDAALLAFAKLGAGGAKIEALEGKFDRMVRSFGRNADEMLAQWQEASMGVISESELMAKANYLALVGIPIDELDWMLTAVQNAAQATGQDFEFLFDKLTLGLARSTKRLVDDLGLIIDVTAANEAYARSIDKTVENLTEQDRKQAFLMATREAAAHQVEYLGEVTETSFTIIARAGARFKDAGNALKKAFTPIVARAAKVVTKLLDAFIKIPGPIKQAVATVLVIAAAIGAVVGPILTIIGLWPVISTALAAVGGVIGTIAPYILAVVAVLGVLAAAIAVLVKAWKQDWGGIKTTVMKVIDAIRPYITMIVRNVQMWMNNIRIALMGVGRAVRDLVEPALKALGNAFENNVGGIKTFLRFLNDVISVVMSTVMHILTAIRMILSGDADKAWKPLADAALNVMTIIVMAWRKYIRKALIWGWNLVVNLANGIIRAARTVLTAAANFVGQMLKNFFGPGSPPKMGILRGILEWGKGLIDTYLKGFALADFGILRDTLAPIKQALQSAVDLGDMDQADMLKVFRGVRQQAAALIADFRKTGEINEDIMAGIAQRLGEGGEEYTKYLRLTLEHQKALQNLGKVQEEVAAAEARGFVPAELKAKLAAAQDEVDAKAEAVDWQREYLAALQEGVDLQREMIAALKELTEAMKGEKGEEGLIGGDATELAAGGAAAEVKFEGFGGFSKEFQDTKDEIKKWFEELPNKIKLWLAQTGLKIIVWLQQKKAQVILWLYNLLLKIGEWEYKTLLKVGKWLYDTEQKIKLWLLLLGLRILGWLLQQYGKLRTSLLMIGAIILAQLLIWRGNVLDKLREIRCAIDLWFVKLKIKIRQKLAEVKTALILKWLEIKTWVDEKLEALKATLTGVIEDVKDIGRNIIGGLWGGLKEKWEEVKTWWAKKMAWLHGSAEDELETESPSKVFYRIGQSVGEGYIRGVNERLAGAMRGAFGGVAARGLAAVGGLHADQIVIALPNVTDGFNAEGITDYLQSLSDQADLRGKVPGGIMG